MMNDVHPEKKYQHPGEIADRCRRKIEDLENRAHWDYQGVELRDIYGMLEFLSKQMFVGHPQNTTAEPDSITRGERTT